MDTREHRVIDIERHDPRVSGDQAYARAFSSFGRRPGRSSIKLLGFLGLVAGLLGAQDIASSHMPVDTSTKVMTVVFFVVAVIGVGLWLVDSVRKHPQAYAEAAKMIGILLAVAYVAHRVRRGVVHVIADGVAEAENRHHGGW
jgi:hypothetical protein